MNNKISFVIQESNNTSYIDSLLIGLFYKSTNLRDYLSEEPKQIKFYYLQDLIMTNFITNIMKGYSIDTTIINEIRNYSIICGWKNGYGITDLFDIVDYLTFILSGLSINTINLEIININTINSKDDIIEYNEKYIIIKLDNDDNYSNNYSNKEYDLRILLEKWKSSLINSTNPNIIKSYRFKEIPKLIPIFIERNNNNYKIDIKKRISFNDMDYWTIHSIICYSNYQNGHYYTLFKGNCNEWFIFDNLKIPSISEIDIKNELVSSKIKQECVLIFYHYEQKNEQTNE